MRGLSRWVTSRPHGFRFFRIPSSTLVAGLCQWCSIPSFKLITDTRGGETDRPRYPHSIHGAPQPSVFVGSHRTHDRVRAVTASLRALAPTCGISWQLQGDMVTFYARHWRLLNQSRRGIVHVDVAQGTMVHRLGLVPGLPDCGMRLRVKTSRLRRIHRPDSPHFLIGRVGRGRQECLLQRWPRT